MYSYIWRRLPGGWKLKSLSCFVLFMAVVAVLFLVVFPYLEPRLPWEQTGVGTTGGAAPHLAVHIHRYRVGSQA